MDKEEIDTAIRYGTHAYASKEAEFIHAELVEQVQAGYVEIIKIKDCLRSPQSIE